MRCLGGDKSGGLEGVVTGVDTLFLHEAYALLDVPAHASDEEVKQAYRRLMHQHHPDRLVREANDTVEAVRRATDQSSLIRQAYDVIKKARR